MKSQIIDVSNETCLKMFRLAEEVARNSFPKPNKVGVALLTKKGNIYLGVSYHSDVYTLTMHTEATALAHAAIHCHL